MPQRLAWLSVGLLCIALAVAGVILPLLPTTPFLLVAAYAFARSSPRLHAWLLGHRRFGPLISDWQDRGAIHPRAKTAAATVMVATFLLSVVLSVPGWVLAVQALVLGGAATFVLTRPS